MKKLLSLFLAAVMLFSVLSAVFTAEAASAPAKVTGVSMVTTVDRFKKSAKTVIKWKKVKGVTGYQLKLGEGPYDGKYYYTTATVKGAKKTSIKYSEAYNAGIAYSRVKIRAYKVKGGKTVYGPWSKVAKIKVNVINQVTGFKGKVVDTHHDAKKLSLSWNKVKGAEGYQIIYSQWTGADMDEMRKINVKGTSYTGWMGYVGIVKIRWYKTVNGKKKYSDFSDKVLDYTPDWA